MDRIRIVGGRPLTGTIPISGAKNATLPLMIASLLTDQTLILDNVPRLADVSLLQRILSNHGVDMMVPGKRPGESQQNGHTIHIVASRIVDTTAPYDLVSKMRASFWVIAPLVARMGEAKVSMPGGCAIGTRPIDFHLQAMRALGAEIDIESGYVLARAKRGLKGARIEFPKVSVGATHTALMAASLAEGEDVETVRPRLQRVRVHERQVDEAVARPHLVALLGRSDSLDADARPVEDEEDLLVGALEMQRRRPLPGSDADPLDADPVGGVARQRLPVAADVASLAADGCDVVPVRDHVPIMSRSSAARSRPTALDPASPPSSRAHSSASRRRARSSSRSSTGPAFARRMDSIRSNRSNTLRASSMERP